MTPAQRLAYADALAADTVGSVDVMAPPHKAIVVLFHPEDTPAFHALFSNAAAADLVPVLRALLARIEAGSLRMPVAGGTVRWVACETPTPDDAARWARTVLSGQEIDPDD